MFRQASATDTKLIIKGLIILLAVVTVGLGVVEYQLASLTQRPAQEGLFFLRPNEYQLYWTYVLGNTFPIKEKVDGLQARQWFAVWHQQFINEALTAKQAAGQYWQQAKPVIDNAVQDFKVTSRQVVDKLSKEIHEYR